MTSELCRGSAGSGEAVRVRVRHLKVWFSRWWFDTDSIGSQGRVGRSEGGKGSFRYDFKRKKKGIEHQYLVVYIGVDAEYLEDVGYQCVVVLGYPVVSKRFDRGHDKELEEKRMNISYNPRWRKLRDKLSLERLTKILGHSALEAVGKEWVSHAA